MPDLDNSPVDENSEKVIATLHDEVKPYARTLVHRAAAEGITIRIISGLRTYAEQNALYAKGRTKGGRRVTNAPGGFSNHNFGIAFDVGVFKGGKYIGESPLYNKVGKLGKELGLEWGGDWKSIVDEPHFQLRPPWTTPQMSERTMLTELRKRHDAKKDVFA